MYYLMQSTLLKADDFHVSPYHIHNFDSILLIENATTQLVGLIEKKKNKLINNGRVYFVNLR